MKISKWTLGRLIATFIAAALIGLALILTTDNLLAGAILFVSIFGLVCVMLFAVASLGASVAKRDRQTHELLRASIKEASRSTYHANRSAEHSKQAVDQLKRQGPPQKDSSPATAERTTNTPAIAPRSLKEPPVKGDAKGLAASGKKRSPIEGDRLAPWVASRQGGPSFEHDGRFDNSYRTSGRPFAYDVPVAMIADDFTFNSFKDEFKTVRLTPNNWREAFEKHQPRMFFCESAWQGSDPKTHLWQGKVYASVRWPQENRTILLEIVDHCRRNGIPTVFWNKEDPTHFGDRINDFIRTAALFDYVFTTAEECVESYKKDVGLANVDVLPFAVQPKLFNPQGIADASDNVNFAGTWYGMYQHRSDAAAQILDLVLESGRSLVIYDRMYSNPNPIYRYPERFQQFTKPAIAFEETAAAYKRSRFGITLNTVNKSKTMFARRVFELAASGSVVLSNAAVGVEEFFGDSVIFADRDPERYTDLTPDDYRQLQRAAMNVALRNTYTHRAETILSTVGIDVEPHASKPAGLVTVQSISEYDRAIAASSKNGALDGLIVAVDPRGEQSLETKLVMRRDHNVTVAGLDALECGEYRTRNLLRSPAVVKADTEGRWPDPEDIEYLQVHASHYSGRIQLAVDPTERFTVGNTNSGSSSYIPADQLLQEFRSSTDQVAFQV